MFQTELQSKLNYHCQFKRRETYNFIHSHRTNADERVFEVWAHLRREETERMAILSSHFIKLLINFRKPFAELDDVVFVIGNTIPCKERKKKEIMLTCRLFKWWKVTLAGAIDCNLIQTELDTFAADEIMRRNLCNKEEREKQILHKKEFSSFVSVTTKVFLTPRITWWYRSRWTSSNLLHTVLL